MKTIIVPQNMPYKVHSVKELIHLCKINVSIDCFVHIQDHVIEDRRVFWDWRAFNINGFWYLPHMIMDGDITDVGDAIRSGRFYICSHEVERLLIEN
jgi:hypothetical protein